MKRPSDVHFSVCTRASARTFIFMGNLCFCGLHIIFLCAESLPETLLGGLLYKLDAFSTDLASLNTNKKCDQSTIVHFPRKMYVATHIYLCGVTDNRQSMGGMILLVLASFCVGCNLQ